MASSALRAAVLAVAALGLCAAGHAQLQDGFYKGKCGSEDVEGIVRGIVQARFAHDAPVVAHLLRMQFHECGVRGCDGSLLIDGHGAEKTAPPNLSVKGYDLIEAIKKELEKKCPGVVSCSDIQILATRDAVALAGGQQYQVRTGRKDGKSSRAADVNLPAPESSVGSAIAYYGKLGLSPFDMVLLLGAHTVGVTHCGVIKGSRLYNFGGKRGALDPNLNALYAYLFTNFVCPNTAASDTNIVFLDDVWSALKVDNNYYKMLQQSKGVLPIDRNLYMDPSTKWIVDLLANTDLFAALFPQALVKLGEVGVLTGSQGEVRKVCSKFN